MSPLDETKEPGTKAAGESTAAETHVEGAGQLSASASRIASIETISESAIETISDKSSDDSAGNAAPELSSEDAFKMSLWEHLVELRKRVTYAGIALFISAGVAWAFRVKILAWLLVPYERAWANVFPNTKPELQTLAPADVFVGYMQLSIVAGIIGAVPIIFYQLWAFISPGLYAKEKKFVVPFVFFSTTLFLSGVAFAYYVAFPFTFQYFLSLLGEVGNGGTILTQRPTLGDYLDFATRMILALGFVFELPLLISFLVLAGIVTTKQLFKFSRWAVILAFVLAAFITPGPEITSQVAVAGALVGLYFLSILLSMFVFKPRKKDEPPAE